jgi:hypothetical protein
VLALFLVFFVPGFLSLKVHGLLVPGERRDFSRAVFDAVAYSALNFGVLLPLIALMRSGSLPAFWWYASTLMVLVACPIAWPFALVRFLQIPGVAKRVVNPIPRAWDCVFDGRESYWIIVHLKDQRRIGGLYSSKSFSSSSPAGPEIFLEQVWRLDEKGAFIEPVGSTKGILILGEEMLALEFFEYD